MLTLLHIIFLGENKFVLKYGSHVFPHQSYIWSTTVLHNEHKSYIYKYNYAN